VTITEALSAYLKGYSGLTALVKDHIYPVRGRQKADAPYVIHSILTDEPSYSHEGDCDATETRFQIDCYASTLKTAWAIAKQVTTALQDWSASDGAIGAGFKETASEFWDDEVELYFVQIQFKIQHGY